MKGSKVLKIELEGYGSFFGTKQGTLLVRDKDRKETTYPLFENEIGTVVLRTGNLASVGALATCGFFGINVLIMTQRGNPVAVLRSLEDDSHVKTRICQYESLNNGKLEYIMKKLVIAKAEGYDQVLKKQGLRPIGYVKDDVTAIQANNEATLRSRIMSYESKFSKRYFDQIFRLFDERYRPEGRNTFLAYDGLNNTFNLGYEILNWRVHVSVLQSRLEPFLGYLHALKCGKPSLVLDLMEIYRYMVDDLIISFCRDVTAKDFVFKIEKRHNRQGKRQYLNKAMEREFRKRLNALFQSTVKIPRIMHGKKQQFETLISEEALLLAKYIRGERKEWAPRIVNLT